MYCPLHRWPILHGSGKGCEACERRGLMVVECELDKISRIVDAMREQGWGLEFPDTHAVLAFSRVETMSESKSALEGIPVTEKGFPLGTNKEAGGGESTVPLAPIGIVGHCPRCNSPIYGPKTVHAGKSAPVEVRRSCDCFGKEGAK